MLLFILRFIPSGIIDLHISFITKWYVLVMAEMPSGSSGPVPAYMIYLPYIPLKEKMTKLLIFKNDFNIKTEFHHEVQDDRC